MIKKIIRMLILGAAVFGLWAFSMTAFAAEFEVTNDNVNIRSEADRTSSTVGSTNRGRKFTIEGEATDSEGNIWYRVNVEGNTYGYIRSDLGRVSGGPASEGDGLSESGATPIPPREATISQSSVRVRSGPSTSHSAVGSLQRGTVIILSGEIRDSSDRTWYYMTANQDGQEISGFVRSDLIAVGDLIDVGEGAGDGDIPFMDPEEGEVDGNQGSDESSASAGDLNFEIRYSQNDEGIFEYYLYDRGQATQWKIDEFLQLRTIAQRNQESFEAQIRRERAIIIILAVVIVILVLILTVLILKIRDLSEDMEADSLSRPDRPQSKGLSRGKIRFPGGSSSDPARRTQGVSGSRAKNGNRQDARSLESDGGVKNRKGQGNARPRPEKSELKAAEGNPERPEGLKRSDNPPQSKPAPAARKPQNFLTDDDEFEFEFLNIDE